MIPASRGIARIPHLHAFLEEDERAVLGWGMKRSGRRAREIAARKRLPFLLLEDGFLRSVERFDPPLSILMDDLGIHYDASSPSRLEKLVTEPLGASEERRTTRLVQSWREGRVSKYNHAREYEGALPRPFVLVVDQAFDDASVRHGRADASSFARMLQAAIRENPGCTVLVKTHPDVVARGKRGYFDPRMPSADPRVGIVAADCHPVRLIEEAEAVYTVTSQLGFEALIWGKPVRCFGLPFYAGWGLTEDDLPPPGRRSPVSLAQLVHAALVRYPRYRDPHGAKPAEVETVLAHIALQRRMRARFAPSVHALGFSWWKQPILKRFLAGSELKFVRRPSSVPSGATVAVWGRHAPAKLPADARIIRVEDGFLRSVGLGADLTQPLSWICDDEGIYYDASSPSRLERLLSEADFDDALLERARKLRRAIVEAGLTKYNLEAPGWTRPRDASRVILVPGQVESDDSIRFGAPLIKTNHELLCAVRSVNPEAYIVYKPHPDVAAGLRRGKHRQDRWRALCDEVLASADMAQLLGQVDEVHTLTSLAGFEALLRDRTVTCYGQPFYAGWGLTADIAPIERRKRRLSPDELVAGCLILYPAYLSRFSGRFVTPEEAVGELGAWRAASRGEPSLPRKLLRPLLAARRLIAEEFGKAAPHTSQAEDMEASRGGG
ncbi:capsular polysaccharide biosynthesis protein [Chelativorans sp. AA-79]|uniref:capsular polysaccharide biosynthesis protein n=1 Tax=Chelativorans sp. AA-79 TaxID=3028735 RepID=UPI0023FA4A70|nr:capsular polysaccharide biosynthesis protein [Chelativorans sp. AA-79]WEX10247.1 capsular polysaccharide biosynthesis protein [Chelativorans sp. AA-79]